MKRNLINILLLLLAVPSISFALPPAGSLTNADNPHNMSSGSLGVKASNPATPGDREDQICVFCHTPHSATPQSPLWSRPAPDGPVGGFPVYAKPLGIKNDTALTGYDATSPDYPSGASRMCLSCHDGVTSIGVLLDGTTLNMSAGSETVTNNTIQGIIDLSVAHPVSFVYDDGANVVLALLDPSYQLPDGTVDTPLDSDGKMQCTTCHDPHVDTRGDASYDNLPFWRHQGVVNSYDEVCESCHIGSTATPGTPPIHNIP